MYCTEKVIVFKWYIIYVFYVYSVQKQSIVYVDEHTLKPVQSGDGGGSRGRTLDVHDIINKTKPTLNSYSRSKPLPAILLWVRLSCSAWLIALCVYFFFIHEMNAHKMNSLYYFAICKLFILKKMYIKQKNQFSSSHRQNNIIFFFSEMTWLIFK